MRRVIIQLFETGPYVPLNILRRTIVYKDRVIPIAILEGVIVQEQCAPKCLMHSNLSLVLYHNRVQSADKYCSSTGSHTLQGYIM